MIKLKPPTHRIDGAAVLISMSDSAWDFDKIRSEREAWVHSALEAKRDAAKYPDDPEQAAAMREAIELTHDEERAANALAPFARYHAGVSRFQLGAPDWAASGKPCTVRDYLRDGQRPAEFGLRRLSARDFAALVDVQPFRVRLVEAARLGLRSIAADGYTWTAKGDEVASDEQLEALHAADPSLLAEVGVAVLKLSSPLADDEKKPATLG